jgi:hypothetical protein
MPSPPLCVIGTRRRPNVDMPRKAANYMSPSGAGASSLAARDGTGCANRSRRVGPTR